MIAYAQTMPGVEEIAWLEIKSRLPEARFVSYLFAKDQNGIVVFDYQGDPGNLLKLRAVEDVFIRAADIPDVSRTHRDLSQLTEVVARSESVGQAVNNFLRFRRFSGPPTYRVIGRQYGRFGYRRKDLITAVLRGLKRRYPRWTPVADGGDVEFWANLLGSHFLLGIRLSDRTMRHRFERAVELPAALRPSVAAAMVFLTNPSADDVFLDPMCGSGTILWERAQAAPFRRILGGDVAEDRVAAARQNIQAASRRAPVAREHLVVRQWDARQLPLEDQSVDKTATNPPFGKQIGSAETPAVLYPPLLAELERVTRPGGRIVLLTSEYELLKELVRKRPRLTITHGYSVAVLGQWGRIYIIDVN